MKMYLTKDEKYPHVFAVPEARHKKELESDARLIPDRLGLELVALRQREEDVLAEIEDHLRSTGQKPIS